ncbi:MAG: MBL fold metallo-hydrolase [Angelakisella sp.]
MKFWYLNHSGFLVETEHHLLVFDYYTDVPAGGTLEQGVVTPTLLPEDKQLVVFVSHSHFDHYNKVVHRWKKERPDTLLFFGDDIPETDDATQVKSGETIQLEGIEVTALRSTDQGAAFLVKVDGKTIYHGGDLNWWHWDGEPDYFNDGMSTTFRAEVDKLKGASPDLAFLAVDPRLGRAAFWGAQYFMETVGAGCMVPMHFWDEYSVCEQFAEDSGSASFRDSIVLLSHRGQCVTL